MPETAAPAFSNRDRLTSFAAKFERHRDVLQLVIVWFGMFVAYLIAFQLTDTPPWTSAVHWAFANTVPVVVIGWFVAIWLLPYFPKQPMPRTIVIVAASILSSLMMCFATYAILGFKLGPAPSANAAQFSQASPFIWQLMQGMAYFFVALLMGILCEVISDYEERMAAHVGNGASAPAAEDETRLDRMLLRTDRGIITLQVEDIVHIVAADDYAEIVTTTKRHLARISLTECEDRLSTLPFLRIHRSHIIHLAHMVGAESAGNGRLQVHMANGDQLISSRAGAQALRGRSV